MIAAAALVLTTAVAVVPPAAADNHWPWMDTSLSADERAALLLPEMTLEEKADLMAGDPYPPGQELAYINYGIPRLGIPELRMADIGPSVRRALDPTTGFPMGLAAAATWNTAREVEVGAAVREEARLKQYNTVLGPNVDIPRNPWWSRVGESFGEDALLSGLFGASFVEGAQAERDLLVNLKHYNVYSDETNRTRANMEGATDADNSNMIVDERTLQEFYTRPWAAPVAQDLASVMCAYNKVNGVYSCENDHLLNEILRGQLGFEGFVLTDFGASRPRTESTIEGGTNMETGLEVAFGPAGIKIVQAVNAGTLSEALVDERVLQILRTYFAFGVFDNPLPAAPQDVPVEEHGALSRQVASEAITLLKNDDALPLDDTRAPGSIAVVGEGATWAAQQCCAGAATNPTYEVTPLEGIQNGAPEGVTVEYARGVDAPHAYDLIQGPESIPSSVVSLPDGSGTQGVQAVYWDNTTFQEPNIGVRTDLRPAFDNGPIAFFAAHPEVQPPPAGAQAVSFSGEITAPTSGEYRLSLSGFGSGWLTFDGQEIVSFEDELAPNQYVSGPIQLEAGQSYPFRLDYAATNPRDGLDPGMVRLGWVPPAGTLSPDIDEAVELASNSDVAVVVAGLYETEARDRGELDLATYQDELITAVAAANPNTIVVLQSGGPVLMPWLGDVKGVVQAYYSGQEQGNAIADILFGRVNPSGKLPVTYPATETQPTEVLGIVPSLLHTDEPDIVLSEGVNVGYRGYAAAQAEPLFPFGHGLSYTSYDYGDMTAEAADGTVDVSFTLTNTGDRAGSEIAQVYAGTLPTEIETPVQQLAGFGRIDLEPGESKRVNVQLACKSLAYWDLDQSRWVSPAGPVDLTVGASSRDIRLEGSVTLPGGTCTESSDLEMNATAEPVDITAPTFELPGLDDGGLYGVGGTIDFGFTIDDPTATVVATLDGEPIDLSVPLELWRLELGQHTLVVTATDPAGNTTTQTFRFYVKTSLRDLDILLRHFEESEIIQGRDVVQLRNTLFRVRAAEARGNDRNALVHLERFRTQVDRRVDDEAASAALIRSVDAITVELGGTPPGADAQDRRSLKGLAVDPSEERKLLRD
ncbi:glycoside hydrolase family 3 C-terminal domain-containing protein [Cellulosimicrobium cellulans]|uniref:glycoside hydrolase family 3 C-terminal domain-containing protein n=1 Tax=Cellulosimicrobium cellulans TaxID=1710 RepID=UPI00031D1FF4|nr:glycoside hydrolase family 3 C-terminal domain-containing protein [Cellulosimicrobium cellulans]